MRNFKSIHLSDEIIKALTLLNYNKPTPVQQEVIPLMLTNQDIIVKSKTGSGKTASFGIPLCELIRWEVNKPQALVLTPTRELAAQVRDDIINIGRFKRLKATALYGKQSFEKQKLDLKQKTHIVVGTPGRVLDHIQKGTFPLTELRYLIIDEADEMLNMGFIEQVEAIIHALPKERVTALFSATMSHEILSLCQRFMFEPKTIEITQPEKQEAQIAHYLLHIRGEDKKRILKDVTIVENPDSCIIFCNTQEQVEHLHHVLLKADYPCAKLHGGMAQEDRFAVMDDFKKGKYIYLVATNVAARGIDVDNVSLIINYDFPTETASYVHRIGRTGRAGRSGKAITLVTPTEEVNIKELEEYIGYQIPHINPPNHELLTKSRPAFTKKIKAKPVLKAGRTAQLNSDIMKLYFNGGKKKKLRAVDFVGTISKLPGVNTDDIGIIKIEDSATFVDILNGKGALVLQAMRHTTIKGKQLKVHVAKK